MSFSFDQNDNDQDLSLDTNREGKPANPFGLKKPAEQPEAPQQAQTPAPATPGLPVRRPGTSTGIEVPDAPTPTPSLPSRPFATPTVPAQEQNPVPPTVLPSVPTVTPAVPSITNPLATELPPTPTVTPAVPTTVEPAPSVPAWQQIQQEVESAPEYSAQPAAPADYAQQPPAPNFAQQPPAPNFSQPQQQFVPQPQTGVAPQQPQVDKKGRPVKQKAPKAPKAAKKPNDYAGARKKILYTRVAVIIIGVLIAGAGARAMFFPSSGPTPEQVDSRAQAAVDYTGFPTQSGSIFSQQFVANFYTFSTDEDEADRKARLKNYVSDDLLASIEIEYPSRQEYEEQHQAEVQAGVEVPDYSTVVVDQNITGGPFVVAADNLSATKAVYTVKYKVNDGKWTYVNVPVKYNPDNFSITLAGPPSFTKPIQNVGNTKKDEYTVKFEGTDKNITEDFTPDLESYLTAWAKSDDTIINRYIADSATDDARLGLQGVVEFTALDGLVIEAASDDRPQTATQRRAEFTVTWTDPATTLRYTQQYRMIITLNADKKWVVNDIQNFDVLNDHSDD